MNIQIPDNYKVYQRQYDVGPVEFYRRQLEFIIPDVNDTKRTILAYLHHYGYKEAFSKILEDRIVVSSSSLYNFISNLRKEGLIVGYEEDITLVEGIKLAEDNHVTLLFFNIDKTKDEVGHKFFRK